MRRNLACVSFLAECLILAVAIPLDAGIRPSFDLDSCSWNATHIVLVQTTANEGVFSVVESWKGHLKPGESLELPELKPNQNAVPISSYPKPAGFDLQDKMGISEQIPRQPLGSQMILFLKEQDVSGAGTPAKWGPASSWGGMKVSVLWLDGGKAFCFQQGENPGPSALSQCGRWPLRSSGRGSIHCSDPGGLAGAEGPDRDTCAEGCGCASGAHWAHCSWRRVSRAERSNRRSRKGRYRCITRDSASHGQAARTLLWRRRFDPSVC